MDYSIKDLIRDLSKYPEETQVRTVVPKDHNYFYFKLDKPEIELQEEDDIKYVVLT